MAEASLSLGVVAAELEELDGTELVAPPVEKARHAAEAGLQPKPTAATPTAQPQLSPTQGPPAPKPSAPEAAAKAELPWDDIVERAVELLRSEPRRTWKASELGRAVRDSGIPIESLQGVHFALLPRLRVRGAIREGTSGFQASQLLAEEKEAAPAVRAAAPEAPKRELPWDQIFPAAMVLLRADPDRLWGQAELVRAVRDSGVAIDNLQGVHFGLTGRLVGLGAVECDSDGKLRLSALVGGRESDPASALKTAERSGDPDDEVDGLAEEIDACEMFLERMTPEQRTAQVAVWAGRAREIQDRWNHDGAAAPDRRSALRRVFGRLTRITRDAQCGWVDALTPEWSMDWTVYVAFQTGAVAGEEAPLLTEEAQAFWRGRLRGLMLPTRSHVAPSEAADVIAEASEWLDVEDDDLRAAKQRFGELRRPVAPKVRRAAEPVVTEPAAPAPVVPDAVLALTRGKRAAIVGGTGAREEHRQKVQAALQFEELDWAFSERGATGVFGRVEERVKGGRYDLVLFLAGYTSHKSVPLLKVIKARNVPLVYVPRGYSASQIVHALEEQLVRKAGEIRTA